MINKFKLPYKYGWNGNFEFFLNGSEEMGITKYANLAALPGSGSAGDVGITIDTNNIYAYTGTAWEQVAGPNSVTVLEPSVGGSGIQTALTNAANAGGGVVQLMAGTYEVTSKITVPAGANNVFLVGVGAPTILSATAAVNDYVISFDSQGVEKNCQNTTRGNTSITTTTASDAGYFVAGDYVIIKGDDAESVDDLEFNVVLTSGNTGTGVVALLFPIGKTLTSVTMISFPDGRNNAITDLSITLAAAPAIFSSAVDLEQQVGFIVNNVFVSGFSLSPNYGQPVIEVGNCINAKLTNIRFDGCQNDAIRLDYSANCIVQNSLITRANISATTSQGAINFDAACDCLVDSCTITDSQGHGIVTRVRGRRNQISNCWIQNAQLDGVKLIGARDTMVTDNTISDCWKDSFSCGVYITANSARSIVDGNTISRCRYGIYADGGSNHKITNNSVGNSTSYHITLAPDTKTLVANNNLYGGVGGDAAILISGCDTNSVVGNNITDITGKGVSLTSGAEYNLISGNNFVSTSGDAITLASGSANNLVVGNMAYGLTITNSGTANDLVGNKT